MGLFGRDDKSPQPSPVTGPTASRPSSPAPGPNQSSTTLVAASTSIDGRLAGSDDLHIEGKVTGEVKGTGRLVIAESGRAKAQLHARVVMVAGSVEGDVSADDRIELLPSAHLTGNITAPRVIIQEGATFDGQVFMKKAPGGKGPKTESAADKPTPATGGNASGPEESPSQEGKSSSQNRQMRKRGNTTRR